MTKPFFSTRNACAHDKGRRNMHGGTYPNLRRSGLFKTRPPRVLTVSPGLGPPKQGTQKKERSPVSAREEG
eukprot:5784807-Pyramimonas_sp.AAC.1